MMLASYIANYQSCWSGRLEILHFKLVLGTLVRHLCRSTKKSGLTNVGKSKNVD